jgi:hypothetical protein
MKFNTTRHKLSVLFYDHFTLRFGKQHFSKKVFKLVKVIRLLNVFRAICQPNWVYFRHQAAFIQGRGLVNFIPLPHG